ncbi:MAG TPA: substrate-binding domain-containing protein, partial [Telmatospirillum sp.]|nr:substrate-binding domain-containing protein [Telmatospirillum sp.]
KILKSQGPMINLVVGSVDSFNTVVLPEVYRALNSHQPPIRLDIRTLHSIEIYSEVEKRQIDVGFAVRDIVYPNVNVKKCFSSPMVVLCAKSISSPFSTDMVHPSALDPNHELVMPWGRSFSNWHEHWWDPLSPSRIKLDNTHMLMNLLQDPKQWTIVPMFLANAVKAKGSYRVYRLAENPPNYTCYRITHKNPTSVNLMALSILDSYFGLRAAEEMSELDVAAETTS